MPNWVIHELHASKEVINFLMDGKNIDFSKVIPAPDAHDDQFTTKPTIAKLADGTEFEGLAFGGYSIIDWQIENWGTKWNAGKTERVSDTVVRFRTAWSPAIPVIRALSREFLNEALDLRWADEDRGSNAGLMNLAFGRIQRYVGLDDYSSGAINFANHLWGHDYDEPLSKENPVLELWNALGGAK